VSLERVQELLALPCVAETSARSRCPRRARSAAVRVGEHRGERRWQKGARLDLDGDSAGSKVVLRGRFRREEIDPRDLLRLFVDPDSGRFSLDAGARGL